ncbi:hypothetical protein [Mariniplasma anaerobium]|uniref:Uncharacterized protein n=1 Tax=Mariniplasma anaerobium TaxID=2735436 RepID=A0A7U9TI53_9MOLU|nr:hypothetical protein [Mariniplasma anaerobium]BCR35640.1 hypothetical protein MPAN_005330 [Mariniplasma anaerobium]
MELFIVILGMIFCILNWFFFGTGHFHLSFIEKIKYRKFKLGNFYFTLVISISMLSLYVISFFNELIQFKKIILIMFCIEFGGTIIYILALDLIGINNKNKEIIKHILEQISKNSHMKKDEIIYNVRTQFRELSIKDIEKQYNKIDRS